MHQPNPQTWTLEPNYKISTDKALLSIRSINSVFAQDWMYWTASYPEEVLARIIENSLCFGVYKTTTSTSPYSPDVHEQIGFARIITDNVTFAYLTDLYILPEYQGAGLGRWLIDCVDEVLKEMPYLRWAMLRTSSVKSKEAYEAKLRMSVLAEVDPNRGIVMGRRGGGCGLT